MLQSNLLPNFFLTFFLSYIYIYIYLFREFQLITFTFDDSYLSSDQDTNQFFV